MPCAMATAAVALHGRRVASNSHPHIYHTIPPRKGTANHAAFSVVVWCGVSWCGVVWHGMVPVW